MEIEVSRVLDYKQHADKDEDKNSITTLLHCIDIPLTLAHMCNDLKPPKHVIEN